MKHKHGLIWKLRFNLGMCILPDCVLETIENALVSHRKVQAVEKISEALFDDEGPSEETLESLLQDFGIRARVIRGAMLEDPDPEDLSDSDETAGD